MVHVQMDGRPMFAITTMLVRKLFDKPEFAHPFFKVFWSAEPFFQKRFCVSRLLPDKLKGAVADSSLCFFSFEEVFLIVAFDALNEAYKHIHRKNG